MNSQKSQSVQGIPKGEAAEDSARCVLCAVGDRVELHTTLAHDVVMSQQCSGPDQPVAISNAWRIALVNRGWVLVDSQSTSVERWIVAPTQIIERYRGLTSAIDAMGADVAGANFTDRRRL